VTTATPTRPDLAPARDVSQRTVNRVLMLTHRLPYPPDRGDRIRAYHMLRVLAQEFDLCLGCVSDEPVWLQHHQLLHDIASEVSIVPISGAWTKVKAAHALVTGKAITPSCFYRIALRDAILQWQEKEPFDAVLTFCTGMVEYTRMFAPGGLALSVGHNAPPPRQILDLVDVDSLKWKSYAKQSLSPMRLIYGTEARRLARVEAGKYDKFDAITVVSDAERNAYKKHIADRDDVHAIHNGVDLEYFHPLPDASDSKKLVFVGVLNYKPNTEGVAWFVKHVMPDLRERIPGVELQIVGRHPTAKVIELGQQPGVDVVGSVPDVRKYLENSIASIAPLQIARGVQNKVLEAMACGRVVVCSPQAAEGIDATPGTHFHRADDPQEWIDALAAIIEHRQQREQMAAAARTCVEQNYSWDARMQPMVDLIRGDA